MGPALALMYSPTVELQDCQYLQQKHFSQPSLGRVEQSIGDHLSVQGRPMEFRTQVLGRNNGTSNQIIFITLLNILEDMSGAQTMQKCWAKPKSALCVLHPILMCRVPY